MEVNHWDSGRPGQVVRACKWDSRFMWIWFEDEGVIQRRRRSAFPHWAFELRREVHKLIQLRREVRKRGWFRIHMRREVHELSQRGPRRMSVGV